MYRASVSETARRGGATVVAGDASVEVGDFTVDSRSVGEGGCFVCFHGESRDEIGRASCRERVLPPV